MRKISFIILACIATGAAFGQGPAVVTCVPSFATGVQGSQQGTNSESENSDPSTFLGDNFSYFSTGGGGNIIVTFPGNVSTSGDSRPDLCVWEDGNNDCFNVCYQPADAFTENAIIAAGWMPAAGEFWEPVNLYCGDVAFDVDVLVPGFNAGELQFSAIMILDDASSTTTNGSELIAIEAKFVCGGSPLPSDACTRSFATGVQSFQQGTNSEPSNSDPNNLLGDNSSYFSTGGGGNIVVTFPGDVSTSGDARHDFCVREDNIDCYHIRFQPANTCTENAVIAAGWTQTGLFWAPADLYCGADTLDIDALLPGFNAGELRFSAVMIVDDASSVASNGSELLSVEAKFVCTPLVDQATIGNFVFFDINGDGVQDPGDTGAANVAVAVLDAAGNPTGQMTTTDAAGAYEFCLEPGTYVLEFSQLPPGLGFTLADAASDDLDSDVDPATGLTLPITVAAGDAITSVDAGVFTTCGGTAMVAASEVVRLGTPPNPDALRPGLTTGPVLGGVWDPYVDHSVFTPDAGFDVLFITSSPDNVSTNAGPILCGGVVFGVFHSSPSIPFAVSIPGICGLRGISICAQVVTKTIAGVHDLTNALDVTLGDF